MTGIERLVDIVTDGPYSGGMIHISVQKLREICEQIEREVADISGHRSAVVAFVEEKGGLDELERRLMPEGMEWPRFEDGELVGFGDEYVNAKGNVSTLRTIVINDCRDRLGCGCYWKLGKGACAVVVKNGERIKRPPVLAADGEPLEVGRTVWEVDGTGHPFKVVSIRTSAGRAMETTVVTCDVGDGTSEHFLPSQLTHQRPVLDANGVPIKKGDEVYLTEEAQSLSEVPNVKGEPLVVTNFEYDKRRPVRAIDQFDIENRITIPWCLEPGWVTHTKPEPDSWSSVWADVSNGNESPEGMMRRCRALAERGE